ncbi:cytochrome c biogenesis protein ResB, partial [Chromobacterium piscinae]
ALYELLSSMRFAIGLLTILAIASVIGTVLKQNEPYPNYAFEFGQFWFQAFERLGLFDVYHSAWFLTILAFLVLSTTLCVLRNGPGFIKQMR